MPELPEVEAVRRRLDPAMRGARIDRVELRRADLRRPFPAGFARRLQGTRVRAVDRRGKYLLVPLDSGDTLLMHLGMSGSFRIDRRGSKRASAGLTLDRHDHVVFTLSNGAVVTFNDPRRFGLMDLIGGALRVEHQPLEQMGPEPLSAGFDAAALAAACAGKRVALKVALLDQRVVAGVGNIYASEALHAAQLSPLRRASTIATRGGRPRPPAVRLAAATKSVLREAIDRQARRDHDARFRVYEHAGEPCRRRGCGGVIRRIVQAGRSTFYCPICQR
jgi:formamidopyrimidine-DNA glycosylase